jgi:hypothetical protein
MNPDTKSADPKVTAIQELVRQGVDHRRNLVMDSYLNLAFLSGNQWHMASLSRGIIEVENATNELRETYNVMRPAQKYMMHQLFKERPVMQGHAGGQDLSDAEAAKASGVFWDYLRTNNGWDQAEKEAMQWVFPCGAAFIAPVWRDIPSRRVRKEKSVYVEDGIVEIDPDTGAERFVYLENVTEEEVQADIVYDVYHPMQTFLFPLTANRWEKVMKIVTVDLVTRDYIEQYLGDTLPADMKAVQAGEVNLTALDRANGFIGSEYQFRSFDEHEERFLLVQVRERPTLKQPNGRHCVMVGDHIVYDGELPYLEEVREFDPNDVRNLTMGMIPYTAPPVAGRVIPPAPCSEWRASQVAINRLLTDISQNRQTVGRNKIMIQRGAFNKDQFTDEHGEVLEVDFIDGKPVMQMIQGVPLTGAQTELDAALSRFWELVGITDVLRGNNPPQVRSAWHLDILREEAGAPLASMAHQREKASEAVALFSLAMIRNRYTTNRMVEIYGPERLGEVVALLQANLLTDLRVKEGSTIPRNHAAVQAQIIEMTKYGLFAKADGAPDTDRVLAMLDMGTMLPSVDNLQRHRLRARYENTQMMQGVVIAPEDTEDHNLHIEEHLAYMSRREYYLASDGVKASFHAHVQAHIEYNNVDPTVPMGMGQGGLTLLGPNGGPSGDAGAPPVDQQQIQGGGF